MDSLREKQFFPNLDRSGDQCVLWIRARRVLLTGGWWWLGYIASQLFGAVVATVVNRFLLDPSRDGSPPSLLSKSTGLLAFLVSNMRLN